jgi:hypothetical protein
MQRYFSNEPPVYSKPKPQSGPTGSRPFQQDVPPRPPPPVPRPSVVHSPPPIASPLASPSPSSRPTPPVIPHPLPPTVHAPQSDFHIPIPTQYHTTVSLDRDLFHVPSAHFHLNLSADYSSEATSTAASIFVSFTALAQPRFKPRTQ